MSSSMADPSCYLSISRCIFVLLHKLCLEVDFEYHPFTTGSK